MMRRLKETPPEARDFLRKAIADHAPVRVENWMSPAEIARCYWNQGFRFSRRKRKGRYQTLINKHAKEGDHYRIDIKDELLKEFTKITEGT